MSEETGPTFQELLADTIERWYESDSDFARQAGVTPSLVSRLVAGRSQPKPETIKKLAPKMRDGRGRPIPAGRLMAMVYPGITATSTRAESVRPMHPLAIELDKMLADDSPIPTAKREALIMLMETIVAPYRPYMRKRKTS